MGDYRAYGIAHSVYPVNFQRAGVLYAEDKFVINQACSVKMAGSALFILFA